TGGKVAVVGEDDQRKSIDRVGRSVRRAKMGEVGMKVARCASWPIGQGLYDQYARQDDTRLGETFGQHQARRQRGRQVAARRAGGGNHQFRARVQSAPRVVERVDGRARLEVQIAARVDTFQQMPE